MNKRNKKKKAKQALQQELEQLEQELAKLSPEQVEAIVDAISQAVIQWILMMMDCHFSRK